VDSVFGVVIVGVPSVDVGCVVVAVVNVVNASDVAAGVVVVVGEVSMCSVVAVKKREGT
jgi:hypothetical protein